MHNVYRKVCKCAYIYIQIRIHMYIYIHTYIYTYKCVCTCTGTNTTNHTSHPHTDKHSHRRQKKSQQKTYGIRRRRGSKLVQAPHTQSIFHLQRRNAALIARQFVDFCKHFRHVLLVLLTRRRVELARFRAVVCRMSKETYVTC